MNFIKSLTLVGWISLLAGWLLFFNLMFDWVVIRMEAYFVWCGVIFIVLITGKFFKEDVWTNLE